MSTKMLITARLDQRLAMSQQLKQAIALLQYNTLELKQLVMQYIETNPLIETEESEQVGLVDKQGNSYELPIYTAESAKSNYYVSDDNKWENFAEQKNLRDHLLEQTLLCGFDSIKQIIAEAVIDAIDDNGFLTMSREEIYTSLRTYENVNSNNINEVINVIQTFDPVGVASTDLRECLLIQLDNLNDKNKIWHLARKIVSECFDSAEISNTKKILNKLKINHTDYVEAIGLIRTLNPHPGTQYAIDTNNNIEPELHVKKIKGIWQVFLADSIFTQIKINKQYQQIIKQHKKEGSYSSLKSALEEAQWLLSGLKRRNETLLKVASLIIEHQNEFIEKGHEFMKPLNILDISNKLDLHESTVSRVTTGKYIATPRGVFELKYFFPSHVSTQKGDTCSAIAVKSFIKDIINHEDEHVYSDSEITTLLQQKGIKVARRTVTKYREAMNILASYQRDMSRKITEKV